MRPVQASRKATPTSKATGAQAASIEVLIDHVARGTPRSAEKLAAHIAQAHTWLTHRREELAGLGPEARPTLRAYAAKVADLLARLAPTTPGSFCSSPAPPLTLPSQHQALEPPTERTSP